jgi:hypothetical protein
MLPPGVAQLVSVVRLRFGERGGASQAENKENPGREMSEHQAAASMADYLPTDRLRYSGGK